MMETELFNHRNRFIKYDCVCLTIFYIKIIHFDMEVKNNETQEIDLLL